MMAVVHVLSPVPDEWVPVPSSSLRGQRTPRRDPWFALGSGEHTQAREWMPMSVGSLLHAARTDAGMSVDEVAERVRLRRTVVLALEQDDFAICGGTVYARGHLRAIARVLDLDPEALVHEFNVQMTAQGG